MMQNSNRSATKVLIVDDHPVVLSGCRSLFASDNSVKIDEATDAKSGHRAYVAKRPDVTVIDIKLPDVSGFELTRPLPKDDPDARIIMFSMNDDPAFVVRAIEMGAQGYVSKGDDPRMLVKAVRKVAAGDNFISPQLAEAVTFSGASIKANPASQRTARERQARGSRRCAGDFLQDGGQHHLAAQAEARRQESLGPDPDRGGDGARLSAPGRLMPAEPAAPCGRDPFAPLHSRFARAMG